MRIKGLNKYKICTNFLEGENRLCLLKYKYMRTACPYCGGSVHITERGELTPDELAMGRVLASIRMRIWRASWMRHDRNAKKTKGSIDNMPDSEIETIINLDRSEYIIKEEM